MTILEIENNLNNLTANFNKKTFIFDLLLAYGTPKSTIKRVSRKSMPIRAGWRITILTFITR